MRALIDFQLRQRRLEAHLEHLRLHAEGLHVGVDTAARVR
jgi:hypothetical protein